MSIHWSPKGGWSGLPRGRPPGFTWADVRLMLLGGVFVGLLLATHVADGWPAAVSVIDGDTFEHDGVRVRIADIDTPETRGRCPYETDLAARAKSRLRALLAGGDIALHPSPDGRDEDAYGRKLRIVTRGGRSVGDVLVAEGLARTWTGRREPWCG